MTETEKLVPRRRFKEFVNCGAWEQRKLTDIVEFFSGLTYAPSDVQGSGTFVLRSSNVSGGEIVDADNVYVDSSVVNSENVKEGDIIVVVRNGSRSLIGKHAQIKHFMPQTVIGAFMTGIRSKCPAFTNALLNTPHFDKEVAMNMGATINQITGYMFSKMEFTVPSIEEQERIGQYLEHLDNLITLHQRKVEKIKALKSAYLSEMFPAKGECKPKRRFAGFTEEWEQRKLGEVCSEIGDGLHSAPIYDECGDYFFINGNNLVNGKVKINLEETPKVSKETFQKNDKGLDDSTLLLSINGTIGNIAYYRGELIMLGKSAAYLKCNLIDKTFLFTSLQTNTIINKFMLSLTGTTIKNLGLESIKNTVISLPPKEEQHRLGQYFTNLDNLITLHQQKLEKLQNIKKAFLNEMFI